MGNFITFNNDTTHGTYRVITGTTGPGTIVITPAVGSTFTGGTATEVVDRNQYKVTGTLAAGTVTIDAPGLAAFDGGVADRILLLP